MTLDRSFEDRGRFWGKTSLCLGSALSNWFLILLDGLRRSSCSLPKDLWTPKYKLSSGQQNSSSLCFYFPFFWFRIAVPHWGGGPDSSSSLGSHGFLSSRFQSWAHLGWILWPHKSHGCSHFWAWIICGPWNQRRCRIHRFWIFTSPPLLGQDGLRFIFGALSNLMANCTNSGASPTSLGRIFHSLIRFEHLEVYP